MTEANCFETMSDIQLLQDLLSEEYNIFLVLIDQNANELTLPSKLPLSCYENGLKDAKCQTCLAACIEKPPENLKEPTLYRCHRNLFYTVFKTNIQYLKSVHLVAGFTAESGPVTHSTPLLQAIFNLPISLKNSFNRVRDKNTGSVPGNTFGLTQQELHVVFYMVNGLTNQDIATKLYISLNTVKTHIAHIFSKLKVSNRTEASMFALGNGLMEKFRNEAP
jgi:DNA-binding CsgD family transcriptional regulator